MKEELATLVQMAGTALENEDKNIRAAVNSNKKAYENEDGGILRIENESFYHYIVLRSLFRHYPFAVFTKQNTQDLILNHPGESQHPFAVVEMKHWIKTREASAVSDLKEDIEKLRAETAENKLMMLFVNNPKQEIETNIELLSDKLSATAEVKDDFWSSYRFSTVDREGKEMEFWIGGYQVI